MGQKVGIDGEGLMSVSREYTRWAKFSCTEYDGLNFQWVDVELRWNLPLRSKDNLLSVDVRHTHTPYIRIISPLGPRDTIRMSPHRISLVSKEQVGVELVRV